MRRECFSEDGASRKQTGLGWMSSRNMSRNIMRGDNKHMRRTESPGDKIIAQVKEKERKGRDVLRKVEDGIIEQPNKKASIHARALLHALCIAIRLA